MRKCLLLLLVLPFLAPDANPQNVPDVSAEKRFTSRVFENVKVSQGIKFATVTGYKGDNQDLLLDIYEPEADSAKKRPVILWIHGGGFRTGSSRQQNYIVKYCNEFARRGYVNISIDYRLRDGKDMPDRNAEFPALKDAARDANTALEWIRENASAWRIDPRSIYVAGGSAGGRTALTVCMFPGPDSEAGKRPEALFRKKSWNKDGIVAAALLWGAPEPEMRDWSYPYLSEKALPVLLIHGEADSTIKASNAVSLYNALKRAGQKTEFLLLKNAPHTPSGQKYEEEIIKRISLFFSDAMKYRGGGERLSESELNKNISIVRKGEIIIRAKPGTSVKVEQLQHEFWFGAAISNGMVNSGWSASDRNKYKEIFLSNFNSAVTENAVKWGNMEPVKDRVNYSAVDGILEWCEINNIPLRAHNLYWGIEQFIQPWVKELDNNALRETLRNRALTVTARYQGRFAEYDLNNEMIHGNWYEERLGEGITKEMSEWARLGDPAISLYLNDYDILTGVMLDKYMAHIRKLLSQGVMISGIGVQGHLHGEVFDRRELVRALDSLSLFGLPIKVTEFNMPGQRSKYYERKILKMTPEEEEMKAAELEDYYRICFAHPAVKGILMWGFWEGANWIPVSSLYRRDWSPTPAADAYRKLVFSKWWTNYSGKTDDSGLLRIPAFYGKYKITVDGKTEEIILSSVTGRSELKF